MYLIVIMASILNISHLPLPLHNLLFDKFGMFLPPPRGVPGWAWLMEKLGMGNKRDPNNNGMR